MNFLERKNLLLAYQFGFPSGLGAADLLTALNREWLTPINTGGAVRVLSVDIAGAFDKASHAGVLHKLSSYGVGGSLTDYLSNRTLQVVVGGANSQPVPVAAGVPQESPRPNPFAADFLPDSVYPATYADDTTLYSTLSSAEACATM